MSQITPLLSYIDLTDALNKTASQIPASEAHGLACGIICSTPPNMDGPWEKLMVTPAKNAQGKKILQQLYMASYQQMSEFSFDFMLLLPDDNTDINERAEALATWCQGFLMGLQQGPLSLPQDASADAVEALQDLTEIAQLSYGDISATNDDETAYIELVEYVRLSVLMLYHEIKSTAPTDHADNDNLLH